VNYRPSWDRKQTAKSHRSANLVESDELSQLYRNLLLQDMIQTPQPKFARQHDQTPLADLHSAKKSPAYIDLSKFSPKRHTSTPSKQQSSQNDSVQSPKTPRGNLRRISRQSPQKQSTINEINEEIKRLRSDLPESQSSVLPLSDPQLVTSLVRQCLENLDSELASYTATKKFTHIRKRITEVREVFHLVVRQLQEFNKNNIPVNGTLHMLMKLQVS
jgi:hypothetical protein